MNEYFYVEKGTREEIIYRMEEELHLTSEQAENYFDFILENLDLLSDDDEALIVYPDTEGKEGVSSFMTDRMTYYVNLERVGIYFLVFLMNLPGGSAEEALLNTGKSVALGSKKIIINLKNHPEARCILLETAKRRNKGVTMRELCDLYGVGDEERRDCINNHYTECVRRDDCCCLKEEEIKEIMGYLVQEGAVKKRLGGRYYYQM